MRLSMDLELQDIPGQLVLALEPFKKYKGNIIGVVHHRDRKTPMGKIPVRLIFEIEKSNIDKIKKHLEENGIGRPYQINAALIGWAGNLISDSNDVVAGDDD